MSAKYSVDPVEKEGPYSDSKKAHDMCAKNKNFITCFKNINLLVQMFSIFHPINYSDTLLTQPQMVNLL